MSKKIKKIICVILAGVMVMGLAACGTKPAEGTGKTDRVINLMADQGESGVYSKTASDNMKTDLANGGALAVNDLAVKLIQKHGSNTGENVLISPLSIIYALSMTANGADGNTLSEMVNTLGADDIQQLNSYLRAYLNAVSMKADTDPGAALNIANSIWFKEDDRLTIEEAFLKANSDYYDAGAYELHFDDAAIKTINSWVEEHTGGLIKDMLSSMPENAVMFLVNALSFDADWAEPYYDYSVNEQTFHGESGEQTVEMMMDELSGYLEDDKASGFIKYYEGYDYYFAALLPNEGVSVGEYLDGLTGERLYDVLSNFQTRTVITGLPKFEEKSSLSLKDSLIEMGMADAFNEFTADFKNMGTIRDESGEVNIYIGDVLHDTFIHVDEKGTQAGAATVVEMFEATAAYEEEEPKRVILDRPFVYMLVDASENIPLFIGTIRNIEG